MKIKLKGEIFWLWRLIDSEGEEIKILPFQKRRNAKAARFLKRAFKMVGSLPGLWLHTSSEATGKHTGFYANLSNIVLIRGLTTG
jgi:hypothetical protein